MRSLAFLAILAITTSPAHAEFCGSMGLDAHVVSGADRVLPGDGGVVVAALPGGVSDAEEANQPQWRFSGRGKVSVPRRKTLAPGLVVYRPIEDGALQLVDGDQKARTTVYATRRARPRLAAPVVKWTAVSDRLDVVLELAAVPPEDAIAIVLAGKEGARSWSLITPGTTEQSGFVQAGCQMKPAGTVMSKVGDEITYFFVDAYGRASLSSKPITIADTTPRERRVK